MPHRVPGQQVAEGVVGKDRHLPLARQHRQCAETLQHRGHQHAIHAQRLHDVPALGQFVGFADQVGEVALALATVRLGFIARGNHRLDMLAECAIVREDLHLVVLDQVIAGVQHIPVQPHHGVGPDAHRRTHRSAQQGAMGTVQSLADARRPETRPRPEILRQGQRIQAEAGEEPQPWQLANDDVEKLHGLACHQNAGNRQRHRPGSCLLLFRVDIGCQLVGLQPWRRMLDLRLDRSYPDGPVSHLLGRDVAADHDGAGALFHRHPKRGGLAVMHRGHGVACVDVGRRIERGRPPEQLRVLSAWQISGTHCR